MTPPTSSDTVEFNAFAATAPGLETTLAQEMAEKGFSDPCAEPGGVGFRAAVDEVMRAHLVLRCAARILLRLGEARITHLSQLDKWARKLPWAGLLNDGAALKVEASAKRSKLYHTGAIAQRIETAARSALGSADGQAEAIKVLVRMEKDHCTVSLDASGAPLHKRGFKLETAKAPLRETLAAAFLRQCGYDGNEPVLDPMCGSGAFILEAAEIAAGLPPGRERAFSFLQMRPFVASRFQALKEAARKARRTPGTMFYGFDRDAGAVKSATANAERAGVKGFTTFQQQSISDLRRPDGPPGLVMVNPPYGDRIGDKKRLHALYAALGAVLKERFHGWRVGLVTNEASLAKATALPFEGTGPPIPHGSLKIRLYRTGPLSLGIQ